MEKERWREIYESYKRTFGECSVRYKPMPRADWQKLIREAIERGQAIIDPLPKELIT